MDQERWRRVEGLFHAALEREPEARQAFLDGACNADADLWQQVELRLFTRGLQQDGQFEKEWPAVLGMLLEET